MANNQIELCINNEHYSFTMQKVKRENIYGQRVVKAYDKAGNECQKALFEPSENAIYPKGATGSVYINKESGRMETPQARGYLNRPSSAKPSFYNLEENAEDTYLSTKITAIYLLSCDNMSSFMFALDNRFMSLKNYQDGISYTKRAFVFNEDDRLFLLIGDFEKGDFVSKGTYCELDDRPLVVPTSIDDIDFGMNW